MLNRKYTNLQRRFLTIKILCLATIAFTPLNLLAQAPAPKPCFDFTGTGRTSFATISNRFTSAENLVWNILGNGDGSVQVYSFGLVGTEFNDGLAPGYYDNDNRADAAVIRASNPRGTGGTLTFYIRPSTLAASNPKAFYGVQWGLQGDIAAGYAADYDGDGRDDLTVIRRDSSSLMWFILRSNTNTFSAVRFGSAESDSPVTGADYNGDGRAEITVIRRYFDLQTERSNTYFAGDSNTGALVLAQDWGLGGNQDVYVIGDYLGDRRADFAVMRQSDSSGTALNGIWYILENGGSGQIVVRQFGYGYAGPQNDLPICGDYNGDGKQDIAVYRRANRTFYWLNSPDFNNFSFQQWGAASGGNLPVGVLHTFIQ